MDFVTLSAVMDVLRTGGLVLLVVLGFTAVIFVHELGHFLAAKKVGIRVERFAIGFGPRLFGFRRGETDYCINVLPLGGYVKMTGQEDFRLEKEAQPDPRAFNNKPVGARALVIASGVLMNVLFAGVLFMVVFMIGMEFPSSQVGDVAFGSPAYGVIQPGDRIVRMDGRDIDVFRNVQLASALHRGDQPMEVEVIRDGRRQQLLVQPRTGFGDRLTRDLKTLGVGPDAGLVMVVDPPAESFVERSLKKGDRIIQADGRPVQYFSDLVRLARDNGGPPIRLAAQRKTDAGVERVEAMLKVYLAGSASAELELLGARPRPEIVHVAENMPAHGKLKPDDILVRAGDVLYPTFDQLVEVVHNHASRPMHVAVERDGRRLEYELTPDSNWIGGAVQVGIVLGVEGTRAVVGQVNEGSVFGEAGLPPGAAIVAVLPADAEGAAAPATQPATASAVDIKPLTWSRFYQALVAAAGSDVIVRYDLNGRDGQVRISVPPVHPQSATAAVIGISDRLNWTQRVDFSPAALPVKTHTVLVQESNPAKAVLRGGRELVNFIGEVYVILHRLATREVSVRNMSGPVGIAWGTYKSAEAGLLYLLYFLAMISANLAVINFLPLPIVDGGLMVFLLIEKVRGKPVSLRVLQASQVIGIVLIIGLFLFVTWQDVVRWLGG